MSFPKLCPATKDLTLKTGTCLTTASPIYPSHSGFISMIKKNHNFITEGGTG